MNLRTAEPSRAVQILWIVVFVLIYPVSALGYEEGPVESGGIIRGKVYLSGPPPPARIFHLVLSPNMDFCGRVSDGKGNRLLQEFRVSPEGGLTDVVVALIGVERGKPFERVPQFFFQDCEIQPFVVPIRNGFPIQLTNQDPIPHDVQAYSLKGAYTFGMFNRRIGPDSSIQHNVELRKNHFFFRAQCGIHAYMQSWGMAVGNPYFSVSDETGAFEISEIPPGTYHLIAWHPLMEVQAQQVTIQPDGSVRTSFTFYSNEVQIPLHDLQTGYRFDTVLRPEQIVIPEILQHR